MKLSNQRIESFRNLYKNRFGKEINQEEAMDKGIQLLRLIQLTYVPITQEEYGAIKNRQKVMDT